MPLRLQTAATWGEASWSPLYATIHYCDSPAEVCKNYVTGETTPNSPRFCILHELGHILDARKRPGRYPEMRGQWENRSLVIIQREAAAWRFVCSMIPESEIAACRRHIQVMFGTYLDSREPWATHRALRRANTKGKQA